MLEVLGEWFTRPDFQSCMFIKASGEYRAADPDALARQLLLPKEGAIVMAHLRYTEDPAGDALAAARGLLDAETTRRPARPGPKHRP